MRPPMTKEPHPLRRAIFLARVVAGLDAVREAARLALVGLSGLAGGTLAALAAGALFQPPASAAVAAAQEGVPAGIAGGDGGSALEGGGLWIAGAGVLGASFTALLAHGLLARRRRRREAAEFAHLARRLGESRTQLSELRTALARLSRAIERAVPEVLAENDSQNIILNSGSDDLFLPAFTVSGSDRDQHLARRLLRISRAAAFLGGADLELKRIPFAGPCAEVLEQYRRLAGPEEEIVYIENGGGEWLAAPIDRILFVQVLRELLDNVTEHAGDWSRITVTTEPVSDGVLLRVRDNGRGIPPEAQRGIMSGLPSSFRGLGLPLVRAIVEAHGGSFRIESEPGHGTIVSLRFPTHA
jgi:signal transduction histidine kinase